MRRRFVVLLPSLLLITFAVAQSFGTFKPVVMAPVEKVQMREGASKEVSLDFRIGSEFHINSHTPKSPLLIPTVLKLTLPAQLTLAELKYPAGQDETFAFSPDEKLNVYSGDFSINAVLKTPARTPAGTYSVTGELRFQACDHSACYPPRTIPVQFQVTVVK